MKNGKAASWRVLALVGGVTLTAFAKERELQKSEVPEPVLKTVTARYPGAHASRFVREDKKGATLYEVKLEVAGHPTELMVASDGTLVAEEQVLEARELPAPVTSTLAASPYASARLLRAEKEVKGKDTHYELIVEARGKQTELVFDESGKLIQHEEKKAGGHEEEDGEEAD